MEDKNKNDHVQGCKCVLCAGWSGMREKVCSYNLRGKFCCFLLCAVLGVIALAAVFLLGVKVGEWKSEYGFGDESFGKHGYGHMMRYEDRNFPRGDMMPRGNGVNPQQTMATSSPTSTPSR